MAFVTADRVQDSSTSTGTGAFTVSGTAPTGMRTFSTVLSVGNTFNYCIQNTTSGEWEIGVGTYSALNTITRTTVLSSSNSNSVVTFGAGTKDVFLTIPTKQISNSPTWQGVQTSSFTAVAGNAYPVNTTSGAIIVTLPAGPATGQIVQIADYAGTWATNNVTVGPNGSKINSGSASFIFSTNRQSVAFVYIDATQGWIIFSGVNVTNPPTYLASQLVVAGGGGAGYSRGGGGGGGGHQPSTVTLTQGNVYSVTVGAGGSGSSGAGGTATSGNNSVLSGTGITTVTSIGGGKGGDGGVAGTAGGSGGGGTGTSQAGGSGTSGQGFAGGAGGSGVNVPSGGGGGASAVGVTPSGNTGGAGGAGTASSITGSSVTYAGGGGGGSNNNFAAGNGGAGGGGNGGASSNAAGSPGTANTGGGGGGGRNDTVATNGGAGGSGVVILSVPTVFYTGTTTGSPTVTTSGTNTIITFTASGSYTA